MFAQRQAHAQLFERFGVFTEAELRSRAEIQYETYAKAINIEARTMIDMASKQFRVLWLTPAPMNATFLPRKNAARASLSFCIFATQPFLLKKCRRAAKTPGNGYLIYYSHFWPQAQPKRPAAVQKRGPQRPFFSGFRPTGEKRVKIRGPV